MFLLGVPSSKASYSPRHGGTIATLQTETETLQIFIQVDSSKQRMLMLVAHKEISLRGDFCGTRGNYLTNIWYGITFIFISFPPISIGRAAAGMDIAIDWVTDTVYVVYDCGIIRACDFHRVFCSTVYKGFDLGTPLIVADSKTGYVQSCFLVPTYKERTCDFEGRIASFI